MTDTNVIREEICETGRRLYAKGFAAGNDGNISYRLSTNEVLCTPTLISKGYMKPDDLCVVDLEGNQLSGEKKRTSEVLMHLEIYKGDPEAQAVVHCHPPHATAFAVARVDLPSGILPEAEVFLGVVPRGDYDTPGSQAFAETVRPFLGKANTLLLSNHGAVAWGKTVEQAWWRIETLDAYCRILMLAAQLGNVERLSTENVQALMELRKGFGGGPDPREQGHWPLFINTDFGRETP